MSQIVHRKRGQIHEYENYPHSNAEKCPDDWMSGDDPMTGAEAFICKPSEQAHCPEAFDADLTKAGHPNYSTRCGKKPVFAR